MFCIQIFFLEPVGAELLWVEPEPIFFTWSWSGTEQKNIWSRSRGKMVRLRNTANNGASLQEQ